MISHLSSRWATFPITALQTTYLYDACRHRYRRHRRVTRSRSGTRHIVRTKIARLGDRRTETRESKDRWWCANAACYFRWFAISGGMSLTWSPEKPGWIWITCNQTSNLLHYSSIVKINKIIVIFSICLKIRNFNIDNYVLLSSGRQILEVLPEHESPDVRSGKLALLLSRSFLFINLSFEVAFFSLFKRLHLT